MKIIKLRRDILRKERNKEIVEKVTKKVQIMSEKYLKLVNPKDFEEVSRRFSMLTESFITERLMKIDSVLQKLKLTISAATLVEKLFSVMRLMVVVIPEIGPSKCVSVRERVAEFIAKTITHIKNERLENIRENWIRKNQEAANSILSDSLTEPKLMNVSFDDSTTKIIDDVIVSTSFDEFVGDIKSVPIPKGERTVKKKKKTKKPNLCCNKFSFHIFSVQSN